jgi:hypothetical protein
MEIPLDELVLSCSSKGFSLDLPYIALFCQSFSYFLLDTPVHRAYFANALVTSYRHSLSPLGDFLGYTDLKSAKFAKSSSSQPKFPLHQPKFPLYQPKFPLHQPKLPLPQPKSSLSQPKINQILGGGWVGTHVFIHPND